MMMTDGPKKWSTRLLNEYVCDSKNLCAYLSPKLFIVLAKIKFMKITNHFFKCEIFVKVGSKLILKDLSTGSKIGLLTSYWQNLIKETVI